jgi:hypothetical protein
MACEITVEPRQMCTQLQYTLVAALLQSPPEAFELFDNVLILTHFGYLAYFGHIMEVRIYFESIGFVCPAHPDERRLFSCRCHNIGKKTACRPHRCMQSQIFEITSYSRHLHTDRISYSFSSIDMV